jgi:sec-independent protein translocase protein TatA
MGTFSWPHLLVLAIVVLVLFGGRGKISQLMGDFAQGIKAFKKGLSEDEKAAASEPAKPDPKTIEGAAKPADPLKQHAQTERKFEGSTS